MDKNVSSIRRVYAKGQLDEQNAGSSPWNLFRTWFDAAVQSDILDPTAFTLATVNAHNRPDARVVLLKEYTEKGLVFFTNYASKKGDDIAANPNCTALFFWSEFERQIRIHGKITKVSREESAEYFHSRPREAQIGTWASSQSHVTDSRSAIEKKYADFEKKYTGQEIPLPDYWGGYLIEPDYFEFWQGRPGRLHDRIAFIQENGNWIRKRLEP